MSDELISPSSQAKPSQDLKLKIGEVLDKWIPTTAEELKRIPICKGCKYKDCGVVVNSACLRVEFWQKHN